MGLFLGSQVTGGQTQGRTKSGIGSSVEVISVPFSFVLGKRCFCAGEGWAAMRAEKAEIMSAMLIFIFALLSVEDK